MEELCGKMQPVPEAPGPTGEGRREQSNLLPAASHWCLTKHSQRLDGREITGSSVLGGQPLIAEMDRKGENGLWGKGSMNK